MVKKIKIVGWQAVSPTSSGLFDDKYFHSPFGEDNKTVSIVVRKIKPPATGWCSWYAFGPDISQEKILSNASWIAKHKKTLPLEYIIIDDGYSRAWGDWRETDSKKFPHGIKFVSDKIKGMGLKSGLWIAPYVADITSKLYKAHKDWFLKDSSGNLVYSRNALYMPNFIFHHAYLLDYQNPDVEKYIYDSIDIMLGKWGFNLIKLDFLSSIYFDPRLRDSKIPNETIRKLLIYIRKKYPKVYTLCATVPIEPVLGLADSVRISGDNIIPRLEKLWPLNKIIHGTFLKQLAENLANREDLSEVIGLDPDVFVCRKSVGLSEDQIHKLGSIIKKTPGGLKILGDDLTSLPWGRIQKYIFPLFDIKFIYSPKVLK
jgi:alpha-galactosidase